MKNRKVNYIIIEDEEDYICIKDIGPWDIYLTVTNGADIVVEELAEQLDGRRLEYIDSDNYRDELLVRDGKFAGFVPIYK